jgi:hypothetical protein
MATKLDTDKKLFLGKTAVRESTTFGQIRKAVSELNTGEGVAYADLEAHLLANYKPAKSENYGSAFIKAYVRDAVNKFGHLSHEDLGLDYEVVSPPEKKVAEEKPKALTKAQKNGVEILAVIRDRGEVSDVSEVDASKITTETLVQETKKKTKTIDTLVAALEIDGFARTEKVEDSTYVFLTPAGFAHVNEHAVAGEAPVEAAEGTATTTATAEDDTSEA